MEYKWNLDSLYKSDEAWNQDVNDFKNKITASKKSLESLDFEKKLDTVLQTVLSLEEGISKIYTYAHLKHDEDSVNSVYKEMYGKALFLHNEYAKEFCFVEPKILEIEKSVFDQIIQKPELKDFHFYLEKVYRQKAHTLDHNGEHLLALSGSALEGSSKAFSAFNNADIDFADVKNEKGEIKPLSHGLYLSYLRDKDRVLRKNSYESMHNAYKSNQNLLCELLSGQVSKHIFISKARSYPSSLEAALFSNNIDKSVYHSLISTVHENLSSLHDYISLTKTLLGVDKLYPYDLHAPLVEDCKLDTEYLDGVSLVIDSVLPLGKDYQNILKRGLTEEGWVDVFEKKGKRSGAYSSGCYGSHPYILLNYQNTLNDLFTLAHEAGHSMHSYLSCHSQPYHYSQYSIFLAEIASTFNELCLLSSLRKKYKDNKEVTVHLLLHEINFLRSTLFRQTQFAEFELMIHETVEKQIPLTPQLLNESYKALNDTYYGKDLVSDEFASVEWARIPHFYYNFYVYQYATGISAAYYFFEKSKADPESVETYLQFLRSGCSEYPLDILKKCGADLRGKTVVQSAMKRFSTLIEELKNLHKEKNICVK